ncbi:unnamed protein product [Didymodactylos carnosus]|uniref:Uncharacterized protein n=1 Tax=Didymodactylos carnosus TaxID=1234261 RepID=A0A8S2E9S8_9BILA|nr:unnamed protein product [Didymodactylos carnosus]CAF3868994.1 unnamed protein product [Didymodactylos carnosus]
MFRVFYTKSDTNRRGENRALHCENNIAGAGESSDEGVFDNEINAYPRSASFNDQPQLPASFQADDMAPQQQNTTTSADTSSSSEDDDAQLEELICASDVNYE